MSNDAWRSETLADFRYKFRGATAPIPLQMTTYAGVATVGILTLLTDLWRTEGWLVTDMGRDVERMLSTSQDGHTR